MRGYIEFVQVLLSIWYDWVYYSAHANTRYLFFPVLSMDVCTWFKTRLVLARTYPHSCLTQIQQPIAPSIPDVAGFSNWSGLVVPAVTRLNEMEWPKVYTIKTDEGPKTLPFSYLASIKIP